MSIFKRDLPPEPEDAYNSGGSSGFPDPDLYDESNQIGDPGNPVWDGTEISVVTPRDPIIPDPDNGD